MIVTMPELVARAREALRCLSAQEALAEINDNRGVLIDVREPAEVDERPAPLSISIPRGLLELMIVEVTSDPEHPLYLHCATGGRATLAAQQLHQMGYRRVSVITCPIDTVCEKQNHHE